MRNFILLFLLVYCSNSIAQTFVFKGHVTDATSCEDMPFVTVKIESLNLQTQTDFDGNFKFEKLPAGNYTITFIFLAYRTTEAILKATKDHQAVQQFYMDAYPEILNADDPVGYTEPLIAPANDSIPKK